MALKIKLLAVITLGLTSCKTYYIPKESFIDQFSSIDSTTLQIVTVQGPMGILSKYEANPINKIKCVDKKGIPNELNNGPSIETRITSNNKQSIVFYFDRVIIQDSIVYGIQSRFMGLKTSIPLKDITKIEVQDGHKNFHYIKTERKQ